MDRINRIRNKGNGKTGKWKQEEALALIFPLSPFPLCILFILSILFESASPETTIFIVLES
jgi:hypothetical protein